jgi:23S rRNA (adenine2503-C2)-methyltransferase
MNIWDSREVLESSNELESLSIRIPEIGLQFSVHESTNEARDKLVPFKAKMTLEEIRKVGDSWHTRTGRKPFFNYCVHEKNNSDEDIQRLLNIFNPLVWETTISVICESNETMEQSVKRQEELAKDFSSRMLEVGYSTRVFNPAGQDDIGGGCGQLWQVQK